MELKALSWLLFRKYASELRIHSMELKAYYAMRGEISGSTLKNPFNGIERESSPTTKPEA